VTNKVVAKRVPLSCASSRQRARATPLTSCSHCHQRSAPLNSPTPPTPPA
jgi:cytochrome c553